MKKIKFELNKKEVERANKFLEEHRHPDIYKGAIGGHINFIFTPTSISSACSVHCTICDETENITDYNTW